MDYLAVLKCHRRFTKYNLPVFHVYAFMNASYRVKLKKKGNHQMTSGKYNQVLTISLEE